MSSGGLVTREADSLQHLHSYPLVHFHNAVVLTVTTDAPPRRHSTFECYVLVAEREVVLKPLARCKCYMGAHNTIIQAVLAHG